ncbi:hypothetical protein Syun_017208 [Stephania yunnanensis]|uniref:Uncharacterized protein n=1 Tax=Stephania yunnanensis TaxID=152371 RepID=A0AAP0P5M1_9MAGN
MSPSLAYVSAQLRNMQDYMTQSFNAVETTLRDHGDRLRRIESQRLPVRPARDDIASSSDHPPPNKRDLSCCSLAQISSTFEAFKRSSRITPELISSVILLVDLEMKSRNVYDLYHRVVNYSKVSPPNNPKSHSSQSPQNPQIPSRLALCSQARDLRSVARVGDSSYAAFAAFRDQNPQIPSRLALSLSGSRLCGVWRAWLGDSGLRRLRGLPRPKPPNPFSSRSLLSGSRLRSVARVARRLRPTPPSRLPALAIVLGSFMGTDDSKSGARLASSLRVRARSSTRPCLSLFLRSSSSSSRFNGFVC